MKTKKMSNIKVANVKFGLEGTWILFCRVDFNFDPLKRKSRLTITWSLGQLSFGFGD